MYFLIFSGALFAQNGQIRGEITDILTGESLPGANVVVMGTSIGAATDLNGEYFISRVPAGDYNLVVTFIGYKPDTVQIKVDPNRLVRKDIQMSNQVIEGQVVIVTAQAEGQLRAINQQINSNTIVNVVSEEKIKELPDANAAEAIGRLPGVSIQRSGGEANKVVLRGLSDRFSTITVDGVRIAPTDADARGVDLSTISQGSLAGIELYKALTPDKDADAIAGSVNLITKKAPEQRMIQIDAKDVYSDLNNSYDKYDFRARYGERFLNNVLGVQINANLEQRDRSHENLNLDYDVRSINSGNDWEITDFILNYTDEVRSRKGAGLLLDMDTPDGGSIKFNTIYNMTKRDYIEYRRNYPTTSDELTYGARDREQEISTFNTFIKGENHFMGWTADWGLSYAQSKLDFPFDYDIDFQEPSSTDAEGNPISHMAHIPPELLKGPPEALIPYALNNFEKAYLNLAYYRTEDSKDIENTAYLNLSHDYFLSNNSSGTLKFGAKYRDKSRSRSRSELLSPYYNESFPTYLKNANGEIVAKDFTGTRFADLATGGGKILVTNFLDDTPKGRDLFDKYQLYPMVNRDAIREWWDLNRNGYSDAAGKNPEYERNLEADGYFYDITERIPAAYVMNTLNVGPNLTLITGLRMETEDNDYNSKYTLKDLSGFPVPKGTLRDTSATHNETVWLPNVHLSVRPNDFMNVRVAAYRALARPDFNHRLESFVARKAGTFYSGNSLFIGNPNLRAAKAWNFELNTSFFGDKIGLFAVSVFYKDIEDMFHLIDALPYSGQEALDSLGIAYDNPFDLEDYTLTFPYNSTKPTRVRGLEIEHQTNFRYLPGLLKNFVLNYNVSFVRSDTYVPTTRIEKHIEVVEILPGIFREVEVSEAVVYEHNQKLEGQPELFGNIAIGYDIGGFSARLSMFYQGDYNNSFSSDQRSDDVIDSFTRWDLALKQKITKNISILLNVNNLTNTEETTSIYNRVMDWQLLNTSETYGMTADLGLRILL